MRFEFLRQLKLREVVWRMGWRVLVCSTLAGSERRSSARSLDEHTPPPVAMAAPAARDEAGCHQWDLGGKGTIIKYKLSVQKLQLDAKTTTNLN